MRSCRIHNERLARRLAGCTEWQSFEATQEAHHVIGGLGNIDTFACPDFPAGPLHGMSLRIFDPRTRMWSIYWTDDRSCELQPPVVGRFQAGRGEFFGDDVFDGQPIRVRYVWSDITPGSARWEQAFSTDGGATWETNWRMLMTYDPR
jgi:hypothetical protein